MPVLFSRRSMGRQIPTDIGYYSNNFFCEQEFLIVDCCNGLLLLRNGRVVNPATRQWVELPPIPGVRLGRDCKYLVFDPTVSPHYEVFSVRDIIDYLYTGQFGNHHHCDDNSVSTMEWPPTPYIMDVFSSRTGEWEERPFVREGKSVDRKSVV